MWYRRLILSYSITNLFKQGLLVPALLDDMSALTLVSPQIVVAPCPLTSPPSGCHSSWEFLLYYLSSSPGISGGTQWSDSFRVIPAFPDNDTRCQLNAIPTVGFSDPILSYFSAFQYNFDGARMLKEGYQRVSCLPLYAPFLVSSQ